MRIDPETLAKARFKRLTVVRFVGVLLAMVGAAIMGARLICRDWSGC
jgi:hypothetical protein